jgi:hypothetical protein
MGYGFGPTDHMAGVCWALFGLGRVPGGGLYGRHAREVSWSLVPGVGVLGMSSDGWWCGEVCAIRLSTSDIRQCKRPTWTKAQKASQHY